MMRDFSSRLYVPSATDLNLVNAEFCAGLFFYGAVSVEDALHLASSTGNADINTSKYGHSSDDAARCTAVDVNVPL